MIIVIMSFNWPHHIRPVTDYIKARQITLCPEKLLCICKICPITILCIKRYSENENLKFKSERKPDLS